MRISNPSNNPPTDTNTTSGALFTGSYAATPADNIGDDGGHNLSGKHAFCREGNTSGSYQFTQVLVAR